MMSDLQMIKKKKKRDGVARAFLNLVNMPFNKNQIKMSNVEEKYNNTISRNR